MTLPVTCKAPVCTFLWVAIGIFLVASAGPLAQMITPRFMETAYEANIILWICAAIIIMRWSYKISPSWTQFSFTLFLLAVFTLITFPGDNLGFRSITAQSLSLMGTVLMAAGLVNCPRLYPLFERIHKSLRLTSHLSLWFYISVLCALFLCFTISLSWYCYHFLPIVIDSISQYVHAKFMAQGHLYGQSPPLFLRPFFHYDMTVNNGKWYSQYQPLQVVLISLGHRIHAPWLVNPLEGCVTLIAIYALARRVFDEATARISALLFLCSPFVLFMSSEYMSHDAALMMVTLYVLCYVAMLDGLAASQNGLARCYAFVAGLCLGGLFLIRPWVCIAAAFPFGMHAFYLLAKQPRIYFPSLITLALATFPALIFQGWYNMQTTGELFLFPYMQVNADNMPGFTHGYNLWSAAMKALDEWRKMNARLFEWGVPIAVFFLTACFFTLQNRYARLLMALLISLTFFNMGNRYTGEIWGPRYIYETVSCLIILTAALLVGLPVWIQRLPLTLPSLPILYGIEATIMTAVLASGLAYQLPQDLARYSHHYMHSNKEFYFSIIDKAQKPALIFIENISIRETPTGDAVEKYDYVAHTNPPSDDSPIIFARDLGLRDDKKLIDFYPGRHVYIEKNGELTPLDTFNKQL